MLKKLFGEKFIKVLVDQITQSVNGSLKKYQETNEVKMDQILTHVEGLRLELKSLDERLTSKEIKDRSEYGHVQYKLSSLQSEVINNKKNKAS